MRRDRFLSTFEIVRSTSHQPGRPYQQTTLSRLVGEPPSVLPARLRDFRNWNDRWYAESHLEEWVARHPEALYPRQAVHVLASQNYAHLGEKIDLLFVDTHRRFHIIELKADRVASNRGVTPDQIHTQMGRYVRYLRGELRDFPVSLSDYYSRFTAEFLGSRVDLAHYLERECGEPFSHTGLEPLVLCRTFLTEGYDDAAVEFFKTQQREDDCPIRLVYYQFYPEAERHRIAFWEVCLGSGYAEL